MMTAEEQCKLDKLTTRFKRNITALNNTIQAMKDVAPDCYLFFSGDSGGGVVNAVVSNGYSEIHDPDVEVEITSEMVENASCGAF